MLAAKFKLAKARRKKLRQLTFQGAIYWTWGRMLQGERIPALEEGIGLHFIPLCTSVMTQAKSLRLSRLPFPPQNGTYNTYYCRVWEEWDLNMCSAESSDGHILGAVCTFTENLNYGIFVSCENPVPLFSSRDSPWLGFNKFLSLPTCDPRSQAFLPWALQCTYLRNLKSLFSVWTNVHPISLVALCVLSHLSHRPSF